MPGNLVEGKATHPKPVSEPYEIGRGIATRFANPHITWAQSPYGRSNRNNYNEDLSIPTVTHR